MFSLVAAYRMLLIFQFLIEMLVGVRRETLLAWACVCVTARERKVVGKIVEKLKTWGTLMKHDQLISRLIRSRRSEE